TFFSGSNQHWGTIAVEIRAGSTSTPTPTATATATFTPTATATATATATNTPTPTPTATCCTPDIGGQGSNGTVECPTTPVFSPPTASDACGGATVVDDGATTTAGTCGNTYSSTKSWHAINDCGNTSGTVSQTIHVIDTTAPSIGGQGGEGTVECPAT